jgi:hypothetical protein
LRDEAYVRAVNNVEKVVHAVAPTFSDVDRATLQFNIFLLKMMPYYTGIPRKPQDDR